VELEAKAPSATNLRTRLVCALLGALALFCVLAPQASAVFYKHPYLSQFGPDGTENTKFNKAAFIAVDQSSHDVYVADVFAKNVQRFTSAGVPDNFSEGPGAGTNRVPVPVPGGYQGSPPTTGIALAPAGAAGGTAGDLYVAWSAQSQKTGAFAWGVEIYSPNGVHLGTLDGSGNPHHFPTESVQTAHPCGVEVDAAGSVYVSYCGGLETSHVDKYVPTANPVAEADFDSEIFNTGGPLLATPGGLYIAGGSSTDPTFTRYPYSLFPGGGGSADASGQGTTLFLPDGVRADAGAGGFGVSAVDPTSEDLYLRHEKVFGFGTQFGISQLDKAGNKLSFIPTPNEAIGVGVDAGTGHVYVSNYRASLDGANKVRIYDKAELLDPPGATIDTPSNLTYKSAHFTGTVNPGGSGEGYETYYRFECTPSCPGLFTGNGLSPLDRNRELPADGADHAVSDDASELSPETKYEVSLIATNGYFNQAVEDTISFETPAKPPVTAPAVTIDAVTTHSAETAHLSGTVDPMGTGPGQETTYRFEYTSDGVKWIALPNQGPIEGSGPQAVSTELEGLQPNTTYSVRLHAENDGGEDTSDAPDPSFTTDIAAPEVQVTGATHVLPTSAQLNGRVNPKNSQTTYHFQWGTADCASSPCASVPASKDADAGSGSGFAYEKAQISGLSPSSTYHYRIVAESPAGKAVSGDATFTTQAAASACENQRVGASTALPECRAYEMASPVQKNGGDVAGITFRTRAAADGNAVSYVSYSAFPGTDGFPYSGAEYLSSRSAEGWSTHSVTPVKKSPAFPTIFTISSYVGEFSADLDTGVYRALPPTPGLGLGPNVEGATNLLLATGMRSGTPTFQLLSDSVNPLGDQPFENESHIALADASADFSHVVFEGSDNLTADASGTGWKLYEWVDGELRIAGVLPDSACGTPPCIPSEAAAGAGAHIAGAKGTNTQQAHAVSEDGSRVFFTASPTGTLKSSGTVLAGLEGSLYVRIDGTTTTQIDASERSTPDPDGPGRSVFQWASPDGDEALFFSKEDLLDADQDGAGRSLYRYEADSPAGHPLTLIPTSGVSLEHIVNVSEDGSFVYMFGSNVLSVLHNGEIRTVAKIGEDPGVGQYGISIPGEQARMTPSGRQLLFLSVENLTANAVDCAGIGPCFKIYLYSYDDDELVCVSCDPSGAAQSESLRFNKPWFDAPIVGDPPSTLHAPLTADGRHVFFSSPDPLVPGDSNGRYDAYVYDVAKKELRLLSSGQCNCDSVFMSASPSGRDAFFTTRQQLVRIDKDDLADIYDARVDGGIASQNALPPAQCQGDACQAPPGVPPLQSPASAGFSGPASSVAKKAKKRRAKKQRKAKQRKRARKAKQRERAHRGAKARGAKTNRRASR
jgi:hypothetical protein